MAIDIDGIAVLRMIAENPLAFPDVTAELNDVARKLVVKQFKAKATTLELLRRIHSAIGSESFVLILDDLGDPGSATLVKKLDKENPELKSASTVWRRKRLADLASGAAEPATKPPKPAPITPNALAKELKTKMDLAKARDLWREHGAESFTLVLGGLDEKQTQSLAKKLDNDNRDLKTAPPEWCRQRIVDLARGTAEPVFRNKLKSKAMAATGTKGPQAKKRPPAPLSSYR